MVCGLISIVKGISALKNKTKYRKSAIAGIVLSGAVWALLIYVIVQPISDTTPAEDDVTIENSEIVQESVVALHEETEIDTQQNEDADELKEYEDKLNSYKMIISIYENDVDMEKYELDTDIYIDGERYSSPTFSDYIIITPTLEEGTHEICLTKTTGKKEKDSNKIKSEVSPLYTKELEIEATLKNKKEFFIENCC